MKTLPGAIAAVGVAMLCAWLPVPTRAAEQSSPDVQKLDEVEVPSDRYQPIKPGVPPALGGVLGLSWDFPSQPDATRLDAIVVTAARSPQSPQRVPASAYVFRGPALDAVPAVTLDSTLRSVPNFSLFRRTDSLVANPTTQGVSLRGIGPSGASRSLVLLDGVPLNDPFGGWIAWSKIPRDSIMRVEIVPNGGASAWGNAALAGVVQVLSAPLRGTTVVIDQPPRPIQWGTRGTLRLSAMAGTFGTHNESFILTRPTNRSVVQIMAEDFGTSGYTVIAPERRGAIDVPAWSRHRTLVVRWRTPIGSQASLTTSVRSFEETRGNGTPYQRNGTREKFVSSELAGQSNDAFTWTATGYAQDQSFASTFSSVNATRTAETPASDQFAVPATALGASWTGTWAQPNDAWTIGGADVRTVHGETRENFSFANGSYTRQRIAGGSQTIAGMFALHERAIARGLRLTLGTRLDASSDSEGHRRELDRATGALSRDERYAPQHGLEFSPSTGVVWTPAEAWRMRASAQQAFRRPTLNELYRPFRQGANVTESNPNLRTERTQSVELGVEWQLFAQVPPPPARRVPLRSFDAPRAPQPRLTLSATTFHNELRDAVANVTLARGPGTFPLFGTLPIGGTGRQRLNLDRIRVDGAEASIAWHAVEAIDVTASYLYNDAIVERAAVAPALIGKRLAEVPRHNASLGLTWRAPHKLTFTGRMRWIGRQSDDDENSLWLGKTAIADIGVTRPLGPNIELFLNVENVGNARIETARSVDGVVNTGTPRFAFGGVRAKW